MEYSCALSNMTDCVIVKKKEEERKEMQNASSMTSGINYIISRSIEREYTVNDEAYVR